MNRSILGMYTVVVQEDHLRPFTIDNYFDNREDAAKHIKSLQDPDCRITYNPEYGGAKFFILDFTKIAEEIK